MAPTRRPRCSQQLAIDAVGVAAEGHAWSRDLGLLHVADAEDSAADDLESRRTDGAQIVRVAVHRSEIHRGLPREVNGRVHGLQVGRDVVRRDGGLLQARCHQPVDDTAVFGTFADGEDARIVGAHAVVDSHTAPDAESGVAGQVHVRDDARRDHDRVAVQQCAGAQQHATDARHADDLLHGVTGQHLDAERGNKGPEPTAGLAIELVEHQMVVVIEHAHSGVGPPQGAGGLQTQDAAAEHRDRATARGARLEPVGVRQIAEGVDAGQIDPRDRRHPRPRSGGQDQPMPCMNAPRAVGHGAGGTVDGGDAQPVVGRQSRVIRYL